MSGSEPTGTIFSLYIYSAWNYSRTSDISRAFVALVRTKIVMFCLTVWMRSTSTHARNYKVWFHVTGVHAYSLLLATPSFVASLPRVVCGERVWLLEAIPLQDWNSNEEEEKVEKRLLLDDWMQHDWDWLCNCHVQCRALIFVVIITIHVYFGKSTAKEWQNKINCAQTNCPHTFLCLISCTVYTNGAVTLTVMLSKYTTY